MWPDLYIGDHGVGELGEVGPGQANQLFKAGGHVSCAMGVHGQVLKVTVFVSSGNSLRRYPFVFQVNSFKLIALFLKGQLIRLSFTQHHVKKKVIKIKVLKNKLW